MFKLISSVVKKLRITIQELKENTGKQPKNRVLTKD